MPVKKNLYNVRVYPLKAASVRLVFFQKLCDLFNPAFQGFLPSYHAVNVNKKKYPGDAEGGKKVQAVVHKTSPPYGLFRMISILYDIFYLLQVHSRLLQPEPAYE